MKDKRERIMDAAYILFQQQGYQATSIQQIANHCGIAKGSVYSYFSSKQNLLIALLVRINDRVVSDVLHFRSQQGMDKRQRYLFQIQAVLESTTEQRLFQAALSRGTVELSDELDQYNAAVQQQWIDIQVESLLECFGEVCRPWLGDLSLCINGMIDSYCYLLIATQAKMDVHRAAEIIMLAAEGLVIQLTETKPPPAAELDLIRSWLNVSGSPEESDPVPDLLQKLKSTAAGSLEAYSWQDQEYIQELLLILSRELDQENPNLYLLRSLLHALQGFNELSLSCTALQQELGFPLD